METNRRFATLAIHGGQIPDPLTGSAGVTLHRTAAYVFKNSRHAADLFDLKEKGEIYTRMGNPTQEVLEKRMALLEGGAAALALASGTAAIFNSIINVAKAGDEIVSADNLYGGTYTMFNDILPQLGIKVNLVAAHDLAAFDQAVTGRTRAIYIEMIANPGLDVADVEAYAALAQKHSLPLMVDATFATPYLCRPLEHGANVVIHSLTKWLGGHGTAIGGLVVDGNNYDWGRLPLFAEPDPSYHNLRWAHDLQGAPPFITRLRLTPLRNLGACISPDNAWMFLQGLETLPLRMERHCQNALAVANFLEEHPKVKWVRYPGLSRDRSFATAKRYFKQGFGGMVVFGLQNGRLAGAKFIESLRLFSHLANVGDAKSLAIHPASTTHSQLSDEQQLAGGLSPELVRLSIGLEHIDDILEDLHQALKKS